METKDFLYISRRSHTTPNTPLTELGNEELLLESIRLIDGRFPLLDFHQERVDRSRKALFPKASLLKLKKILDRHDLPATGIHKVRILYGEKFQDLEIHPYAIKPVRSLRLIEAKGLRYSKKYANRLPINELLAKREDCDDILITQHGYLTDTSYANIALFDGDHWITPSSPLLRGTRRAQLLATGTIKAMVLRTKDLSHFQQLRLMNSMLPWEEAPTVEVSNIVGVEEALGVMLGA